MPLYDFHCEACGDVHEQLVRGDWKPEPCPCGSTELRRLQGPAHGRPNGIAVEAAPAAPQRKPRTKHDGQTTIDRVTRRLVSNGTPPDRARDIATRTRLRKERRRNR